MVTPTAAATPSLDIRCRQPGALFPAGRPWCAGGAHRAGGMLGGLLAADGSSAPADTGPSGSHDPTNPRATQGPDMAGSRPSAGPETARCGAIPGRDASGSVRNTDPVSSVARPATNSR
jgi:hypothetical protein